MIFPDQPRSEVFCRFVDDDHTGQSLIDAYTYMLEMFCAEGMTQQMGAQMEKKVSLTALSFRFRSTVTYICILTFLYNLIRT